MGVTTEKSAIAQSSPQARGFHPPPPDPTLLGPGLFQILTGSTTAQEILQAGN